ncbi:MAG: 50S ribosomal protein L9 [Patescibacteria group bacterium]
MRVILIQNVPELGKIDEIKDVADGYARNFLFAHNLAVPATKKSLADLEMKRKKQIKNGELELREQQSAAEKLDGLEIEISEKVSEGGALYAAIGPQKVADILGKRGFKIFKNQVIMKPVKEAGEYIAKVKLGHGLEADVTVVVSKK